jgi:hypothetical protein
MTTLTSAYDGTFKSIGFMELYADGVTGAQPDTEEEVTLQHIPGGDRTVLQSAGRLMGSLTVPVGVQGAQLASLRAAVGSSGSLVWSGGTRTARLSKVSGVQKGASTGGGGDAYKAQLLFYLL